MEISTRKQYEFINSVLGEELCKYLAECNAFIAGGAISSLFTNRKINDWDIFFRKEDEMEEAKQFIKKGIEWGNDYETNLSNSFVLTDEGKSKIQNIPDNCGYGVTLIDDCKKLQLITYIYGDIQDIFNMFDFSCCMGAYDFKSKEFTFNEHFFNDNMSRTLRYNFEGNTNPINSIFRIEKYKNYGYTISDAELLKILFGVNKVKLNTRKQLKHAILALPPSHSKKQIMKNMWHIPKDEIKYCNNPEENSKRHEKFENDTIYLEDVVGILNDLDPVSEKYSVGLEDKKPPVITKKKNPVCDLLTFDVVQGPF